MQSKYPLSFLNIVHMTSSCTTADKKNVISVAELLETRNDEMDEW